MWLALYAIGIANCTLVVLPSMFPTKYLTHTNTLIQTAMIWHTCHKLSKVMEIMLSFWMIFIVIISDRHMCACILVYYHIRFVNVLENCQVVCQSTHLVCQSTHLVTTYDTCTCMYATHGHRKMAIQWDTIRNRKTNNREDMTMSIYVIMNDI